MSIVPRPQTITELQVQNIKRIRAIHIKPDGSMVVIGGKNGQGKSSTLDAIRYALQGGRTIPGEPIRRGEKKAEIKLTTQDLQVTRHITKKGSTLKVVRTDIEGGALLSSPQNVLDHLTVGIAFDPLDFLHKRPREQAEELMRLVGLDFSDLDEEHDRLYQERADVNRDVKTEFARLNGMQHHMDVESQGEQSLDKLLSELDSIRGRNADLQQRTAGLRAAEDNCRESRGILSGLMAEEKDLENRLDRVRLAISERRAAIRKQERDVAALAEELEKIQPAPEGPIREKINGLEEHNRKVRENTEMARQTELVDELRAKSEDLSAQINACRAQRDERVKSADMPIEGLGIGDGNLVTYNGFPLEQASDAEKLRISVAIAAACHPEMPVMLVREGSMLDKDSMRLLAQLAEESGCQVWTERVTDDEPGAIIIEDGSVKEEV